MNIYFEFIFSCSYIRVNSQMLSWKLFYAFSKHFLVVISHVISFYIYMHCIFILSSLGQHLLFFYVYCFSIHTLHTSLTFKICLSIYTYKINAKFTINSEVVSWIMLFQIYLNYYNQFHIFKGYYTTQKTKQTQKKRGEY